MAIKLAPKSRKLTKKTSTKNSIDFGDFSITGNKVNPKILFVVDPLYGSSVDGRSAISKPQHEFIGRYLKDGIERKDVAFLTAAPPAEKTVFERDKAIGEHLKECRETFLDICKRLQPQFIIAMGKLGARQVYGRAVQITKVRGVAEVNADWGLPILPSLGINHVMRYPENVEIFRADMDALKRIVADGFKIQYREKIKTTYKWVTDLKFLLRKPPKLIAVDMEGVGLDPFDPKTKILTVHLTTKAGNGYGVDIRDLKNKVSKKIVAQLKRLLENPKVKVVGQNYKFDFKFFKEKLGITTARYEWDTMVMAHIVDENMMTFNLADLTRRYVPDMAGYSDKFDKDPIHQGKTRMDLVPPDQMLAYGCGDTDATYRLYEVLLKKLEEDQYLPNYYKRVIRPGLRAFCDIEQYGFTIDKSELQRFEKYLRLVQKTAHKTILKMVPKQIIEEYAQYENTRDENNNIIKKRIKFNITRQAFLVAMCFTHSKGLKLKPRVFTPSTANETDPAKRVPSTSTKEHFPYFEGVPFIDAITTYIKNEKLLTTYVGTEDGDEPTGFYKYIKRSGIRPTYVFTGTDTGRLSSRDPNGQNFPKRGEGAKRYRKMFVAPKGWVLLSCDLSQVELRAAAYLANETTMLRYFKQGIDLHAATAAKVMGEDLTKFLAMGADVIALGRYNAKAVNFGFLYGMWWKKFMSYAKTQYGIDYTEKQAEAIRNAFFELYPRLIDWHRETGASIQKNGYIRSPLGRIRHLPSVYSNDESVAKQAVRKGINAPVQSFASDLGVMAIGRLHAAGIDPDKFRVIGFVHDDIICMAREEYVGIAARTLKKYMENNPLKEWFNLDLPVKIVAEAAIGYNLSDMVEINSLIKDKNVKTLDDLRVALTQQLEDMPADRVKKREDLAKDITKLTPKDIEIAPVRPRKKRVKLTHNRSRTNEAKKTQRIEKVEAVKRVKKRKRIASAA